jgi:hypothetical protein
LRPSKHALDTAAIRFRRCSIRCCAPGSGIVMPTRGQRRGERNSSEKISHRQYTTALLMKFSSVMAPGRIAGRWLPHLRHHVERLEGLGRVGRRETRSVRNSRSGLIVGSAAPPATSLAGLSAAPGSRTRPSHAVPARLCCRAPSCRRAGPEKGALGPLKLTIPRRRIRHISARSRCPGNKRMLRL